MGKGFWLSALAVLALNNPLYAYATKPVRIEKTDSGAKNITIQPDYSAPTVTHPWMTLKAYEIYQTSSAPEEYKAELTRYLKEIVEASVVEDGPLAPVEKDPFISVEDDALRKTVLGRTSDHFINPQRPEGLKGLYYLGSQRQDSLTYAKQLWGKAVTAYRNGAKETAFTYLGRIAHLLEDAGSPAHVFLVDHSLPGISTFDPKAIGDNPLHLIDSGDPFELWCAGFNTTKAKIEGQRILALPLEDVVKSKSPVLGKNLEELFVEQANAILNPSDQKVSEILKRHYRLEDKGNGSYAEGGYSIDDDEGVYLANALIPDIAARAAGLYHTFMEEASKSATLYSGIALNLEFEDNGVEKTCKEWLERFKNNDENNFLPSIPDIYTAAQYADAETIGKIRELLRKTPLANTIVTFDSLEGVIAHNVGSKRERFRRVKIPVYRHFIDPLGEEDEYSVIRDILWTDEGLAFMQALLDTTDNADTIEETFERLGGVYMGKIRLSTPELSGKRGRKEFPLQNVCIQAFKSRFEIYMVRESKEIKYTALSARNAKFSYPANYHVQPVDVVRRSLGLLQDGKLSVMERLYGSRVLNDTSNKLTMQRAIQDAYNKYSQRDPVIFGQPGAGGPKEFKIEIIEANTEFKDDKARVTGMYRVDTMPGFEDKFGLYPNKFIDEKLNIFFVRENGRWRIDSF